MKILICNERFLFRFGVDRALLILARGFKDAGHEVVFMGNKFNEETMKDISTEIISVPVDNDYLNLNEFTDKWLRDNWEICFNEYNKPDIAIIGGWPFFSSIPFFEQEGVKTIFFDCGAVPVEGFQGGALVVQEKLRSLRQEFLNKSSLIVAISDFIARTQSMLDSNNKVPVKRVLLAADHMESSIWQAQDLSIYSEKSMQIARKYRDEGNKIILCLGRWEPDSYKNSYAAFDFISRVIETHPKSVVLILAEENQAEIPKKIRKNIIPIGFPDDKELQEIMMLADLGVSFSKWEGFNLPLTEMQWLDSPVLAFNVAAHPEVIVDPIFLCENMNDMVEKAILILEGSDLVRFGTNSKREKFHTYFTWNRVINDFHVIIDNLYNELMIIIDVTNACKDPANSGVIRVTRRLSRELQTFVQPIFVIWDDAKGCYVMPTSLEYGQLGQYNGPVITDSEVLSSEQNRVTLDEVLKTASGPSWLLFTETINENYAKKIRKFAKTRGIKLAGIFYDAIPLIHPELCNEGVLQNHTDYMLGLAECDIIVPISNFSSDSLKTFWSQRNINGAKVITNLLPGEFAGAPRAEQLTVLNSGEINILCVSTLEPRKNHKTLIEACLQLEKINPHINWKLTLVGNRYAGNDEIPEYVQSVAKKNNRVSWLGVVDDTKLIELYQKCDFTVYPSFIEGFGMPIMESIWHGKPCICSEDGVMGELAKYGGCLTTKIKEVTALSQAIQSLASDSELRSKLSKEAQLRDIKTWKEYAKGFVDILRERDFNSSGYNWESILYPNCLCDDWQMNHSERLGLTGLLSRIQPKCCIEIGTYKGGSLSLISQLSSTVFSIDIDPSIPGKFQQFGNVSFLTGPSSTILPILLKELDDNNIPVDFILVDGDHSAEGIKKDIACLHSYVPKKPMFVMLHDSFNPECRRGMLEAGWEKSPYAQWVDLDFIPGRIIEHGGGGQGEMWGGLGLAYFSPQKRQGELRIGTTAQTMYEKIKGS
ncbi:glycosyltransferase [Paenibacillus sp. GCM10012303]|uniref:glycosyltransferase n=1 Tax=Paenibacillus sp. GCM10012303 TaxID=3317340 RepID=UPI003616F895